MLNFTPTICPYCGVGCGMVLVEHSGSLCDTLPLPTHPVSQGSLCIKGWNVHEFVHSENRLKSPLIKKNGALIEVSWPEAIDFTVQKLRTMKNTYSPACRYTSAPQPGKRHCLAQRDDAHNHRTGMA